MSAEYIIYTDESLRQGTFYSNFYGGLLVRSGDLGGVESRLQAAKGRLGLRGEVKWEGVTASVADRYVDLMTDLFREIGGGRVKVRIMFTQNRDQVALTGEDRRSGYVKLYYQFIKWAFGLAFAGQVGRETRVRLLLDKLPASSEQVAQFRSYLAALDHQPQFRRARIRFCASDIAEIDSRSHILAQVLDVVLGAMAFRLNDGHRRVDPSSGRRGARTIHKERVYEHINAQVRALRPGFNIGVNTGTNAPSDRWTHPYRHWLFVPYSATRDDSLTKKRKTP